ncbi:hypothetical protein CVT25_009392 [Psilocybe cyanescens]|uniref:Uncharacterized protein n=1 Tax=Psilocybe cyanescens TaxID=93625 RepID=A0A409XVD8_PSICY|nr:hypothetical protein CVT25_009392 [Psilocybe cyanescens]
MPSTSIFTNSNALVSYMLHLDNLVKKGMNNGNILEVFKAQKKRVRNVLLTEEEGYFNEAIKAHHHLFFWTPLYEYYTICNDPDFDPT